MVLVCAVAAAADVAPARTAAKEPRGTIPRVRRVEICPSIDLYTLSLSFSLPHPNTLTALILHELTFSSMTGDLSNI